MVTPPALIRSIVPPSIISSTIFVWKLNYSIEYKRNIFTLTNEMLNMSAQQVDDSFSVLGLFHLSSLREPYLQLFRVISKKEVSNCNIRCIHCKITVFLGQALKQASAAQAIHIDIADEGYFFANVDILVTG